MYELDFNSYYGFPDASRFKFSNYASSDAYIKVLIDNVPGSPINDSYFEEVPSL